VRAGILESRSGDPEVVGAILSDEGLGERQKQVLVDIYESFRRENAQEGLVPDADPDETPTHEPSSQTAEI